MKNNEICWFYIRVDANGSEIIGKNNSITIIRDKFAECLCKMKESNIISNFYFNIQWSDVKNNGHINIGLQQFKELIPEDVKSILSQLKQDEIIKEASNLIRSTEDRFIEDMKAITTNIVLLDKETVPILAKLGFLSHYIRNISGFSINNESFKEEANKLIYLEQNKSKLYKIIEGYINELGNGINESQALGILDIIEINKNLKNPSQ